MPELRRLLTRLAGAEPEARERARRWSRWRRRHQATARRCHLARRARTSPAPPRGPPRRTAPATAVELTDVEWGRVQHLLPPPRPSGRPPRDHRAVVAAVLWVQRTGATWRELPAHFGPWQTVYGRFNRWRALGTWSRVVAALRGRGPPWTVRRGQSRRVRC